jgi:phenylpropionate dioxygenase-like ring-hydroxylating dioxygenase large terminal subunit
MPHDIVIKPRDVMPADARTLPARYYVDQRMFEDEMEALFARQWICAGRVEQIERPGQYFLREVLGESLIITRTGDGAVQAFYNVCRHRGTRLCVEATGQFAGAIQCPYHAWTYALDGRLVGAPHMDEVPHFNKKDYPLRSVHADVWDGHIFISLAEQPAPLLDQLADLPGKFPAWQMQDLRLGHRIVYDVRANWKLIVQNYNECLHCPNLHPALNQLSHYLSGENEPLHPSYMGGRMDLRAGVATMSMDGSCPRAFLPGLSEAQTRGIFYYAVFPNLLLSLHPDYMMVHTLWPLAPDRTINICEWHFHPQELARPDFSAADVIDFWDLTNRQDWQVCELSQAGISSRGYTPGPYSNREDLLYAFDRMIVGVHAAGTEGTTLKPRDSE